MNLGLKIALYNLANQNIRRIKENEKKQREEEEQKKKNQKKQNKNTY